MYVCVCGGVDVYRYADTIRSGCSTFWSEILARQGLAVSQIQADSILQCVQGSGLRVALRTLTSLMWLTRESQANTGS